MEAQTKTVTFREVHEELENEALFVKKEKDIRSFKEKAAALEAIGLFNSIATKLYKSVSLNHFSAKDYERKYSDQYRFIFEPQLERLCEKYNLFVRPLEFFMGDIPEKNVRDITNFKPFASDALHPNIIKNPYGLSKSSVDSAITKGIWPLKNNLSSLSPFGVRISLDHANEINRTISGNYGGRYNDFLKNQFSIAATENLFSPSAFETTKARIAGYQELQPKSQVDLDPIVLFKVKGGYLIITAWGDEANDELVANSKMN